MNDHTLNTWVSEQKRKWSNDPFKQGQTDTVALFSEPCVFDSGNEPPLLAALRRVYHEQTTSSDCSLTSVTMILQALMESGAPANKDAVLDAVDKALEEERYKGEWRTLTADKGLGVTFAELVRYAGTAFDHYGFDVTSVAVADDSKSSKEELRGYLRALCPSLPDFSPRSALLLYVDQGVFWGGDKRYLHVTPAGAYHPGTDRVLIVEVDPDTPALYLSPVASVIDAMRGPEIKEGNGSGGFLWIKPKPERGGRE